MNDIGKSERVTQNRVAALFRDQLGYTHLGDWSDRPGNRHIEEGLLTAYLTEAGYRPEHISQAIHRLKTDANHPQRSLYENNQSVYQLLRYPVQVKAVGDDNFKNVELINWRQADRNHFAIAEEVTLKGGLERRPDIVLYVNGIAIGVIELKSSRVSIGDGIRQLLSNQQPAFNAGFFSTVQIVFAGSDAQGLQYGTIGTPEKFFLKWKEDEADNSGYKLDKYLLKMCEKSRLIELLHDFILFDGGVKKLPRVHQYFGIKAAQEHIRRKQDGIIWHTQGAGKSILMVLLAKWILENVQGARVVVITDRDELDKQIEKVFRSAGEQVHRSSSGRDLMAQLAQPSPRLLCSLVHKFGVGKGLGDGDFEAFIKELEGQPGKAAGELFVFVDECHRTQGGRLNKVMKAMLPGAVFIGFTGTPLLKKDAASSLEVFGNYIHTYKFSEAVEDKVVLDLVYEARDIDQRLGNQKKVDEFFESRTKGLNDWQRNELKKHWGTMQTVLSSRSRMDKIVTDIDFDFSTKPRLSSERGNAMLVASSIYEACKYFDLFQKTPFKDKCAIVTSYNPLAKDVSREETGANSETDKQFIYNIYTDLLKNVQPKKAGMSKTEAYEESAKARFIEEPATMKLLIVVDKLLTGFDAPSCTYLYIDKSMQDHGLFQAICRTNRLDTDDKDFGYIVDYKNLLKNVEKAVAVYSAELDHSAGGSAPEVMLESRIDRGREVLDAALEALHLLLEPVPPPKGELQHIHHFCGNTEIATDLKEREPQRVAFYTGVVSLLRAYGNISDELDEAGYDAGRQAVIRLTLEKMVRLRETIRLAANEVLDRKPYEADMRNLIDRYIQAEEPRKISDFDNVGLIDLIVKTGIAEAIIAKLGQMKDRESVAETIENNVRSKIVKDHLTDPAYFAKMSALLDEIIKKRKAQATSYEEYLKEMADLAGKVQGGMAPETPTQLDTPGKRALYNNLKPTPPGMRVAEEPADYGLPTDAALELALKIDEAVKAVRPNAWRGNLPKENVIKLALWGILQDDNQVERVFLILSAQPEY